MASKARLSASWWRTLVTITSFWVIVGKWAASVSICCNSSVPECCFAEIKIEFISVFGKFVRRNKMASFCSSLMRSDLLKVRIRCLPSQWGRSFFDSPSICEGASVASIIQRIISAWSIFWKVRSIPKFSIVSLVSRIPAVSMKRKVIPLMFTVSSMTSRVVPWMSLTMALSSFNKTLRSVDFPAFVSPIIATGTPFLITLPTLNEYTRRAITFSMLSASCNNAERSANSTSSSLKSNSNSIIEVKLSSFSRRSVSSLLNPPRIWLMARRWVAADVEAIKSATASAWLRSILPFKKALCVNSPGCARRQPFLISNCNTCWRI